MNGMGLTESITLQPLTITRGSDGSTVQDYTQNNVTVRANYAATSGREFYAAQKQNSETQALFIIRYRSVDASTRVLFGTRVFDILFVDDTSKRNGWLKLACKEVV